MKKQFTQEEIRKMHYDFVKTISGKTPYSVISKSKMREILIETEKKHGVVDDLVF